MNNPPAFPIPRHTRHFDDSQGAYMQDDGMTLRDYFAAKALQGLLAGTSTSNGDVIVRDSYAIADAMLKAREE